MTTPSITVLFTPFKLDVVRNNRGQFQASIRHANTSAAAPPLFFAAGEARVDTEAPEPRLWVGGAAVAVPKRQLARVGEWLAAQVDHADSALPLNQDGAE